MPDYVIVNGQITASGSDTDEIKTINDFSLCDTVSRASIDRIQTNINNLVIPTKTSELTNDSGFLTSHQSLADYVKLSSLSTVATSGNYKDLTNVPNVPSKVSELTNDVGFITEADIPESGVTSYNNLTDKPTIPTKVSQLTNDLNFLTEHQDLSSYAIVDNIKLEAASADTLNIKYDDKVLGTVKISISPEFNSETGNLTYQPTITNVTE